MSEIFHPDFNKEISKEQEREDQINDWIEKLEDELKFQEHRDMSSDLHEQYVIQTDKALEVRDLLDDLINFKELEMSGGVGKIYSKIVNGELDYIELDPRNENSGGYSDAVFEALKDRFEKIITKKK